MTMRTLRRWWWASALLVMAVEADVSAESLTKEAVRLVRKDFHKSNKVKNAFQVSSMLSSENKVQSDGTFVKVEFTMKQTKCRRHKWMKAECTPKKDTKKTFNCLGCFKFDSNGKLLETGYEKCVRRKHMRRKEEKEKRDKACAKLIEETVHEPGTYSFGRAPFGRYD